MPAMTGRMAQTMHRTQRLAPRLDRIGSPKPWELLPRAGQGVAGRWLGWVQHPRYRHRLPLPSQETSRPSTCPGSP